MFVYLAGAIRDGVVEDYQWREDFIDVCSANEPFGPPVLFLNPLGGKAYDAETRKWTMSGRPATAPAIYKQDLWCVKQADVIVANLTSLAEGYASIGTLMELGYAVGKGDKLIYLIVPSGFEGHTNGGMFKLHPFLAESAAGIFETPAECSAWFARHMFVLTGISPQMEASNA